MYLGFIKGVDEGGGGFTVNVETPDDKVTPQCYFTEAKKYCTESTGQILDLALLMNGGGDAKMAPKSSVNPTNGTASGIISIGHIK